MAKELLEGDTRINPETGIEEVYTPEGDFIPVSERPGAVNKSLISQLSTDEGEEILDQQTKKFETQYGFEDETAAKITDEKAEKVVIEEEEPEEETKETGYTFEEAQEIWGNDFTGIRRGEDGMFYPDSSAYARAGIKGMDTGADLQIEVDETDQLIEDEFAKWQSYDVEIDPAFISQINAITAQYDVLRRQMRQKNESRQKAIQTIGYRHGTRQYAGAIQLSIEGEELRQAGQRLADITSEELAAKSAARVAYENNEYTKFSQKVDALQKIRNNKADALEKYNEAIIAANEAMREQIKEEREIVKFEVERQEKITDNLAYLALASMTGDEEADTAFIKDFASQYGIDPNIILSKVAKLQSEEAKEKLQTQVVEVGGRKKLINIQTGETIKDLGVADITATGGGGVTITGETPEQQAISNAFNFALGAIPGVRQKQYINTFNSYLQSGNTEMAKDYILKVAYDSMPVSQQEQIATRETLLVSLNEISNDLDNLKASGIDTGFLTGTEEKIKEKIGRTKDPKVQYLQTKILNNVIAFRRAATGVQFNIIEQQQYEQMFPGINMVENVNNANIAALNDTLIGQQETYYKQQIGASNYESVFGGRYQESGFMGETTTPTPESTYIDQILNTIEPTVTPTEEEGLTSKIWSGIKSFFNW